MTMELTQNHFELFDLPLSFDVDKQLLSERYRELQRAVHPDKFANASDRERRLSVQKAAQINEAFQVLKSPQARARYLLELQGVSFDSEQDTTMDPMFLMEQMELREALAEVGDNSDPLTALNSIMRDIKTRLQEIESQLQALLAPGQLSDAQKSQGKQLVHKLQFLNKLQLEAEDKEESLFA